MAVNEKLKVWASINQLVAFRLDGHIKLIGKAPVCTPRRSQPSSEFVVQRYKAAVRKLSPVHAVLPAAIEILLLANVIVDTYGSEKLHTANALKSAVQSLLSSFVLLIENVDTVYIAIRFKVLKVINN